MKKLVKIDGKFCILESELVCSSVPQIVGKMDNVLENIICPSPQREVVQKYIHNGRYSGISSAKRAQELKATIKEPAAVQRIPLTTLHRDNNTTIRPNPEMAKAAIQTLHFSSILIDKIAKEKQMI